MATRDAWATRLAWIVILLAAGLQPAHAEGDPASRSSPRKGQRVVQRATIHWQAVPLRDAIGRLAKLFNELTFLDRRIDPTLRVGLGMSASSLEQVWTRLAAEHGWGLSRVGEVVYLGPAAAAQQLNAVIAARRKDAARLPQTQRAIFARKRALSWPRLAEPRAIVTELVQKNGWQVADAGRIPHDLWSAGRLNGLTLGEQLAMLLIGFDLTYEIRSETRTIQIVALDKSARLAGTEESPTRPAVESQAPASGKTKQVYSLRVAEQPVGAVMRALAQRLNWQMEFDEAAIAAAGRSLNERVSFAVENVEQDELLHAVLRPAGLTFRREGDVIKIVPREP